MKRRKRSVRVRVEAEAGFRAGGAAPRGCSPVPPGARSPQVRPSERAGPPTAPLTRGSGPWGAGGAGSWGSPALRPRAPAAERRTATWRRVYTRRRGTCRDIRRRASGRGPASHARLTAASSASCAGTASPSDNGLPRPRALSYESQPRGVGEGTRTAHAHNTAQEGGGDCLPPIGPRCWVTAVVSRPFWVQTQEWAYPQNCEGSIWGAEGAGAWLTDGEHPKLACRTPEGGMEGSCLYPEMPAASLTLRFSSRPLSSFRAGF